MAHEGQRHLPGIGAQVGQQAHHHLPVEDLRRGYPSPPQNCSSAAARSHAWIGNADAKAHESHACQSFLLVAVSSA